MKTLRLILGDQLTPTISSLVDCDKDSDLILMCEVFDEATYVKHHKKKIAFLFSAMRHFAQQLQSEGYPLHYVKLTDANNTGSFAGELTRLVDENKFDRIILTHPGEYRVLQDILALQERLAIEIEIREDTRFLCSQSEFSKWARGRTQLRMEYFYREMRKKYNILMEGTAPAGGQWNYDAENRKPPKQGLEIPPPYKVEIDAITQEVMALVSEHFKDHFGDLEPFAFAVTREAALEVLNCFIEQRLKYFGDYQDAMIQGEPWMYHAHISFYLNCGLLLPMECIQVAEQAYHEGKASLNAVEGFIRQIMGWREYVRGIYWLEMPDYA